MVKKSSKSAKGKISKKATTVKAKTTPIKAKTTVVNELRSAARASAARRLQK